MEQLMMARRDGFSLLEVMIALVILAIGVLGATTGQIMAMKLSNSSRHATLAMQLAEEQLELLQSMSATEIKSLGSGNDPDNPLDPDPNDGATMAFDRRWIITADSPEANVISLEVEVDWIDGLGRTRTTALQSIKADL
jgi:prepilin-type N-terminal cleavage/methylation domain-containing protein